VRRLSDDARLRRSGHACNCVLNDAAAQARWASQAIIRYGDWSVERSARADWGTCGRRHRAREL